MKFLSANAKTIVYIVERIGISLLMCGFLAYLVWNKLEKIESKLQTVSRNQYAVMKKMGVARVAQPERVNDR